MKLRVWHIPQVGSPPVFRVPVQNPREGAMILNVLAYYDLFQYHERIKPDYSNAAGLEVLDEKTGEWEEWIDTAGHDIDEMMRDNYSIPEWTGYLPPV